MTLYETFAHGTPDFPVGIHDTIWPDGFRLYPHIHREFEFLLLTNGHGNMYINGQKYALCPGDGVFVNSGILHLGSWVDKNPCEFFAVVFAPEIFSEMGNNLIANKYILPVLKNKISLPVHYSREVYWQAAVLDSALQIHKLNKEKPVGFELCVKAQLLNLWQQCFAHSLPCVEAADKSLDDMISAMEFIRAEYASPLTLADIAARCHMSQGYFCRRFAEVMHLSPFAYLLKIRIDNSCRMLQSTKLPIGEVAGRCGFNSFSYFSKKFKELTGCTPMAYRKKYGAGKTNLYLDASAPE